MCIRDRLRDLLDTNNGSVSTINLPVEEVKPGTVLLVEYTMYASGAIGDGLSIVSQ